jgi:hypothetical protein
MAAHRCGYPSQETGVTNTGAAVLVTTNFAGLVEEHRAVVKPTGPLDLRLKSKVKTNGIRSMVSVLCFQNAIIEIFCFVSLPH